MPQLVKNLNFHNQDILLQFNKDNIEITETVDLDKK